MVGENKSRNGDPEKRGLSGIYFVVFFYAFNSRAKQDEVAEWLRRWTANPLGNAYVGSNTHLATFFEIWRPLAVAPPCEQGLQGWTLRH